MKNTFRTGLYTRLADGSHTVLLYLDQEPNVDKLIALVESDEVKQVSIEVDKKKRTLTANNYMWALLSQIAKKMNISLGNCYCKAIKDYGVFVGMFCVKEAYELAERMHNLNATEVEHTSTFCYITNEWKKGDKEFVEFNAFYGSSNYDQYEFSKLLNGVVADAQELGIETLEDMKIKQLMEEYDANN